MEDKYEVIIAGASFAGLAAASRLNSKVLLIDRQDIGSGQTSACATTLKTIQKLGCQESLLDIFDSAVVSIKGRKIKIPLPDPFCTFDYKKFCLLFAKQNKAEFLKADIKGVKNSRIITNKGSFLGNILVDCTGWKAVLASSLDPDYAKRKMCSMAIETEIPYNSQFTFVINKDIIEKGAAWIFPAGKNCRFGVGAYKIQPGLNKVLEKFVTGYGLSIKKVHGNYVPYGLRSQPNGNIFTVGDSAGSVLPLTAEGIRPALRNGLFCGRIIQRIINKEISLEEGKKIYANFAKKNKKYSEYLLRAQKNISFISDFKLYLFLKLLSQPPIAKFAWKRYERI